MTGMTAVHRETLEIRNAAYDLAADMRMLIDRGLDAAIDVPRLLDQLELVADVRAQLASLVRLEDPDD